MNELIVKLYDQATILESNGDYVAGELDPVKFAELIVRECAKRIDYWESRQGEHCDDLLKHFGVEE